MLGFAAGMRRALGSGRGSVAAPILTAVFGVTLIVAGIFPTDPKPGYPPGTTAATTVPGMIHDLNALPCFAALTAAVLVLAVRFAGEPGRRGWVWCSSTISLAVAVTFVLSEVLFSQAAAAGTINASYHGLVQRFTITLGFGWLSVIALSSCATNPASRLHQPEPTATGSVNEKATPNERPARCRNANNSLFGKRLESPYPGTRQDGSGSIRGRAPGKASVAVGQDGMLELIGLRRRYGDEAERQASAGTPAIEVRHLTKDFGDRVAFQDVSFEIGYGEVFRVPRAERRRQDHDGADARDPCSPRRRARRRSPDSRSLA